MTTENTTTENKKAIIFARVSTENQDFTEQVNRMKRVAIADGYKEENLVTIAVKESAIKLSEQEREGLNLLKQAIAADADINCVYVFEISRLGRRMDVISAVIQWFIDCNIQLVCDTPSVRLFEKDGTISFPAQMMIYLMGVMAEQEMKIKKERFANGKRHAKEQGRWIGGSTMFGYKIVNKREVIDEDAAQVIRRAFQMYASDDNRTAQTNEEVAQYLRANNVCVRSDKYFSASRVARFISQKKYRGTIVDEDLWDRANAIREKNYHGSKERKQSFGERLIKCSDCGHNYRRLGEQYVCARHKKEYKGSDMYCANTATINRRFMDCSLVETVAVWWSEEQQKDNTQKREELKHTIEALSIRIAANEEKLQKIAEKKRRIGKNYANMILSDEDYNKAIKAVNAEERQLQADTANMKARKAQHEMTLNGQGQSGQTWPEQWQSFNSLTHAEMYEVIHKLVCRVTVRVEGDKKYWTIHRKDSLDEVTYMTCGKGCGVKLFGYINGREVDLTKNPDFRLDWDRDKEVDAVEAA